MKRDDVFDVRVEGLDARGFGTAEVDGRTVRVPGGATGDDLRVRIEAVSRRDGAAWAKIVDERRRGTDFRRPPCHHAAPLRGTCGGCALMQATADAQRAAKSRAVADALGDLVTEPVTVQASERELGYRNRTNLLVWRSTSGVVHFGSRAPRTGTPAKMDGCVVLAPPLADVARAATAVAREQAVPTWPDPAGLRWVSLRANAEGATLVELIAGERTAPWVGRLAAAIAQIPGVVGVSASGNAERGNAIRVGPPIGCVGETTIPLSLAGFEFPVATNMFAQLNLEVADRMARRAAELAGSVETIWDLYAGIGVLGIAVAAATGGRLFGAESATDATEVARGVAIRAGIDAEFVRADLDEGPPPDWPAPDVVVVNPPRRGLDRAVVERLIAMRAPVLYMSCDPGSFARDARRLRDADFRVAHVEAHDMLPQTPHVELLVRIEPPLSPAPSPS